jgi:hypothetical protein
MTSAAEPASTDDAPERAPPAVPSRRGLLPQWRWRTFPVFFAFAAGLLMASLVNAPPQNGLAAVIQWASIFAFGYGLAHLVVTNVVVAGRMRRHDDALSAREDETDELVYPDEPNTPAPR